MGLRSTNKVWKKDETAALIALFETERCLYDDNDEQFHNTEKQMEAYERICSIMLRIRPDCTVDEIKYKIKFLRRQYAGELLHRNISVKSGLCTKDTYKPAMWCFDLLRFLDDFLQEKNNLDAAGSSDAIDESDDHEDVEENISRKKKKLESSSSSEREMVNTSSPMRKSQNASSERKLQNISSSDRKFHNMSSSERKFQNMSPSERKFQNMSSSQRKFQNMSSSERKFQNMSSSERKFQSMLPSERKFQSSSSSQKKCRSIILSDRKLQNISSERKMHSSSSSERELKNCSFSEKELKNSSEREIKNGPSPERELLNTSSFGKTLDATESIPAQSSLDREDIFGQYVASELRALRSNPLLYLQTKQSILESLTSANFELINPE